MASHDSFTLLSSDRNKNTRVTWPVYGCFCQPVEFLNYFKELVVIFLSSHFSWQTLNRAGVFLLLSVVSFVVFDCAADFPRALCSSQLGWAPGKTHKTVPEPQKNFLCLSFYHSVQWCVYSIYIYMWPWTTKPVIRVHFYIYTSSESWINKLSIDVWFVMIGQYTTIWKSGIWGCHKI